MTPDTSIIQQLVSGIGIPNFVVLIPEILVLITAFTIFILEMVSKNRKLITAISLTGLGTAALFIFVIASGIFYMLLNPNAIPEIRNSPFYSFIISNFLEQYVTLYNLYIVDIFSLIFKFFLIISTMWVLFHLRKYAEGKKTYFGEYYYLIIFALLGMMIVVSSPNLISFYIGLELMSIALYILIGIYRKNYPSKEGAFKYLIIGGTGTAIVSYAIAFIYGATGTFDFSEITKAAFSEEVNIGLLFGMLLLVLGLALKASAVPLHFWTPDAYEGAPTPITAYLAGPSKIVTYAVILRIMVEAFPYLSEYWSYGWAILAALSMVIGNFIALRQKNVKRMLAYSSIAHTGYIVAAIAAPTGMGFAALIFYSLVYVFMAIGALLFLAIFERFEGWTNHLDDFKGLARRNPIMALIMLIYMFSMLGIPPTVGFIGKLGVLLALIGSDIWWLAVVLIVMSIVSAGYYLKVVANMYMYEPVKNISFDIALSEKISMGILAAIIIYLGIYPTQFWQISTTLSSILVSTIGS